MQIPGNYSSQDKNGSLLLCRFSWQRCKQEYKIIFVSSLISIQRKFLLMLINWRLTINIQLLARICLRDHLTGICTGNKSLYEAFCMFSVIRCKACPHQEGARNIDWFPFQPDEHPMKVYHNAFFSFQKPHLVTLELYLL